MHEITHQVLEIVKTVGYFILVSVMLKFIVAKWIADKIRSVILRLLINSRDDLVLYWAYRHKAGKHKPSGKDTAHE